MKPLAKIGVGVTIIGAAAGLGFGLGVLVGMITDEMPLPKTQLESVATEQEIPKTYDLPDASPTPDASYGLKEYQ